jgi:glycosyltransferase involved in cell wall biosynthesis
MPLKILVLSSTRKERDGIAEYTRQVFNPAHVNPADAQIEVLDITPANMLAAPFRRADVVHVQHEFFLFDRLVGVTALAYFPWLWLLSWFRGYRVVTTIHSTYDVTNLAAALPHFRKLGFLFPLGALYLRFHFWLVVKLSRRVVIISKIGLDNLRRVISPREFDRKVRYTHLGNYAANIRMKSGGLLQERFGIAKAERIFTLFGFAFPNKGYEYGIYALDELVNKRRRRDARLIIVSGETGKGSFPGGGQGGTYIGWLKQLTAERGLENYVIFTGYLANHDPLLEEIFADTFCFLFPYLDRQFPSGAISTVLATRKPILVSAIRCFEEYEGLLTFREKDAVSLADRMVEMMDHLALVTEAERITQHNAAKFGMARILARHLEVYREATAAAP